MVPLWPFLLRTHRFVIVDGHRGDIRSAAAGLMVPRWPFLLRIHRLFIVDGHRGIRPAAAGLTVGEKYLGKNYSRNGENHVVQKIFGQKIFGGRRRDENGQTK